MDILQAIQNMPPEVWELVVGGVLMSPMLQGIKHKLSVQSDKVMFTLTTLTALVISAGVYISSTVTTEPWIVAVQATLVSFSSQPVYFFVVKPVYKWWMSIIADADKERSRLAAEAQTAVIPADGLPAATAAAELPQNAAQYPGFPLAPNEDFSE